MNNPQRREQMLKGKTRTPEESSEQPGQYRDNPKVNARIDEYVKNNPKHWDYIKAMPRERLERALVLTEVNKLDRQEKINAAIMRKLDQNPELKQAYETLVKHLPEDQREKTMVSIASRTMRSITPRQTQSVAGARV
jgi:hypothetical protein